MSSDAFSQLVATAVADAQRPLFGVLEELRSELAETRRELQSLREEAREEPFADGGPVYLSLAQVAERLGVSPRTARRWLDSGQLPHVRLPSGSIRVSVAELERVLRDTDRAAFDEQLTLELPENEH